MSVIANQKSAKTVFLKGFFEVIARKIREDKNSEEMSFSKIFDRIKEVRGGGSVDTYFVRRCIGVFVEHNAKFDNDTARFYIESSNGIIVVTPCQYQKETAVFCVIYFSVKNSEVVVDVCGIGDGEELYNPDEYYRIEKIDIDSKDAVKLCEFYKIALNKEKSNFFFKNS